MKQTLIWFNLQRDGTGNGFSNIKNTFTESLQQQMSVQRCASSMWSLKLIDGWTKYKEKVSDVSHSNQNLEKKQSFKFMEITDLFIKRVKKN